MASPVHPVLPGSASCRRSHSYTPCLFQLPPALPGTHQPSTISVAPGPLATHAASWPCYFQPPSTIFEYGQSPIDKCEAVLMGDVNMRCRKGGPPRRSNTRQGLLLAARGNSRRSGSPSMSSPPDLPRFGLLRSAFVARRPSDMVNCRFEITRSLPRPNNALNAWTANTRSPTQPHAYVFLHFLAPVPCNIQCALATGRNPRDVAQTTGGSPLAGWRAPRPHRRPAARASTSPAQPGHTDPPVWISDLPPSRGRLHGARILPRKHGPGRAGCQWT
ncbi:hypothetical protein CONPUDRAFT_152615 [Coniophora puteana RWD-64-598 SS2]|uniref:Uncharacterized protein n=1 Tax=Coniophora puteana (strain RWD-64-598) TaxID=741705 RepID=A0A5M3MRJ6_CONPW|nr:uncharacterized protein CONPUDRAFT_152615 [Coniophora puteana RWD-64-598 SS2]EIW81697.1 hypothetical protein CONPUDRAFT_152615 [Coniophora puteana RWD-64-598 SS2]